MYVCVCIYIYIYTHTHTHIRYCRGNCLVGRDTVYSGSTQYSVKCADCIISVMEFVLTTAQISPKRR
jgi:hypothetical protein